MDVAATKVDIDRLRDDLNFVNNQARDATRSLEHFDDATIEAMRRLLKLIDQLEGKMRDQLSFLEARVHKRIDELEALVQQTSGDPSADRSPSPPLS